VRLQSWFHSFPNVCSAGADEGNPPERGDDDADTDERADARIRPVESASLDADDDRRLLVSVGRGESDGEQESRDDRRDEADDETGAGHTPTVASAG
jgi:hypothetical protein